MKRLRDTLAVLVSAGALGAAVPGPPDLAERIGCYVGGQSEYFRTQVAAGRAPLLVINGEPAGPLRYDRGRCTRVDVRGLQVGEIRALRPSAARSLYGNAAVHGAVVVDYAPPPAPRSPRG